MISRQINNSTMKNMILVLSILLFSRIALYSQDPAVGEYLEKIENQMVAFYTNCAFSEENVEDAWKEIVEIKGDIEDYIKKGGHSRSVYQDLTTLENICETLDDYMICVGDWNRFPIRRSVFDKGVELMQANMAYLFYGNYCVNIIELTMGNYKCLLAENRGSTTIKVKYNFGTPTGNQTGEMGLSAGHVRVMVNNRDCRDFEKLVVNSIQCISF